MYSYSTLVNAVDLYLLHSERLITRQADIRFNYSVWTILLLFMLHNFRVYIKNNSTDSVLRESRNIYFDS